MKTYWDSNVRYFRSDKSWGSASGAIATRDEALAEGFETASYYLLECGYPSADVTVSEFCDACNGQGKIRIQRPRSVKVQRCNACKGHVGPLQTIGPFPARIHCNAKHRCEPAA